MIKIENIARSVGKIAIKASFKSLLYESNIGFSPNSIGNYFFKEISETAKEDYNIEIPQIINGIQVKKSKNKIEIKIEFEI